MVASLSSANEVASEPMTSTPVRRALLSVSDKTGIVELAGSLASLGIEIISTGGTAGLLRASGLSVRDVGDVTGFPEIMDGRVKTLHPGIHGGLLARRDNLADQRSLERHGIALIDLLVVTLYPFEAALARRLSPAEMIELIDIGGPAMIRAAAKNCSDVAVVVDTTDYSALLEHLHAHGGVTTAPYRLSLAAKAFARTAAYDAAIASWFQIETGERMPERCTLAGRRILNLRYGENPHQQAAFYAEASAGPSIATARQLQGKELSYNNIADADAALACAAEFEAAQAAACVIVKHGNPCGVARAADSHEAFRRALACDSVSAFGGVIALNRPLDAMTAAALSGLFIEVLVAPDADDDAVAALAGRKNLRLLLTGGWPHRPQAHIRSVAGGFLVQTPDDSVFDAGEPRVVTQRKPTAAERSDLEFAFIIAKHVKSNAVVLARDGATVGIGAGQSSRLDASRIAVRKAEEAAVACGAPHSLAVGAVAASDAFFPMPDALTAAADAGVTAFIQPGGSLRDDEVIAAADRAGAAMVFTGRRHFRH
jgi:phosphoribosylaminoimidazolecarboxamide formyltransferase/IMP cyclohydrolase